MARAKVQPSLYSLIWQWTWPLISLVAGIYAILWVWDRLPSGAMVQGGNGLLMYRDEDRKNTCYRVAFQEGLFCIPDQRTPDAYRPRSL